MSVLLLLIIMINIDKVEENHAFLKISHIYEKLLRFTCYPQKYF